MATVTVVKYKPKRLKKRANIGEIISNSSVSQLFLKYASNLSISFMKKRQKKKQSKTFFSIMDNKYFNAIKYNTGIGYQAKRLQKKDTLDLGVNILSNTHYTPKRLSKNNYLELKIKINYLKDKLMAHKAACFQGFIGVSLVGVLIFTQGYKLLMKTGANLAFKTKTEHGYLVNSANDVLSYDSLKNEVIVRSAIDRVNQLSQNKAFIEELDKDVSKNSSEKIAILMEKYGLSYNELIDLINKSSLYSEEYKNILSKYSDLSLEKLGNILKGNDTLGYENIYIGDSRMQGMLLSGAINNKNTLYGVGYGYNWFVGKGNYSSGKTNALSGAINGLDYKVNDGVKRNIVIWLGVNDYKYVNAGTYFDKFVELATGKWSKHSIYVVAVGPVNDSRAKSVNNSGINNFNSTMQELITRYGLDNLHYVDLNFSQDSVKNYDKSGLHYGKSDYLNIYNLINEAIRKQELSDTENIRDLFYRILKNYGLTFYNNDDGMVLLKK